LDGDRREKLDGDRRARLAGDLQGLVSACIAQDSSGADLNDVGFHISLDFHIETCMDF